MFSCRFIWIEWSNADTIAWILISHVENTFTRSLSSAFLYAFVSSEDETNFFIFVLFFFNVRLSRDSFYSQKWFYLGWSLSFTRFSLELSNKWPQLVSLNDERQNCFNDERWKFFVNAVNKFSALKAIWHKVNLKDL